MYLRRASAVHLVMTACLVACAAESITKGWFIFVVWPAMLVGFPLVWVMQVFAGRQVRSGRARRGLVTAAALQLVGLLGTVVFLVGFGDTEEVYLFGFTTADLNDPVTDVSWAACGLSVALAAAASLWLLISLLAARKAQPAGLIHQEAGGVRPSG